MNIHNISKRKNKYSNLPLEKGRVLVSKPFIPSPIAPRQVILLLEIGPENTIGLCLNESSEIKLSNLFPEYNVDSPIYIGGDYGGEESHRRLMFLYSAEEIGVLPESIHITSNIYFGGSKSDLDRIIRNKLEKHVRFFYGYHNFDTTSLKESIDNGFFWVNRFSSLELFSAIPEEEKWEYNLLLNEIDYWSFAHLNDINLN